MERGRKRRIAIVVAGIICAISVAAWFAAPSCMRTTRQFREAVLRQNLDTLRKTIDAYTYDKRKAPQSLDDLVSAGYLKYIPKDPITNQPDWEAVTEDVNASIDQTETGVNDVRSASSQVSTEGTAYNTW